VPHLLTDNLRQKRNEYATAMLPFLHAAKRDGWDHLVTGDESWFFFNTSPCRMWTLSREDVITKPKHQIQSKKFMFTILWNPTGFHVVDKLPNDAKINSAYFVTIYSLRSNKRSFLEEGSCIKNDLSFMSTIAQFTQVGHQESGSTKMTCSVCHSHPIRLIWHSMTSTCFLQ
jgi:hypothetical protein